MTPNSNLPALSRSFAGYDISVPAVFAPGDTLDADAANWVNGQIATVVGNAFGGALRRARETLDAERAKAFKAKTYTGPVDEKGKPAPATNADVCADPAAKFAEIFADYSLASNRGSGEAKTSDPVASLVRTLATQAVKAKIIAKGLKVRDFITLKVTQDGEEMSKLTALVNDYIAAHPELHDTAQSTIDNVRAEGASEDIDLAA